jgi:DNA polymerase-1
VTALPDFNDPRTLYVVDLSALVHRFWHIGPAFAARNFLTLMQKMIALRGPARLAIAEDNVWPTFRHELRADYKAKRKKHESGADRASKLEQLRIAGEMAEDMLGARRFNVQGFEGDDVIASLASWGVEEGLKVVLIAVDKDIMQLVSRHVVMWDGKANGFAVGPAQVFEKLGVEPNQVVDYLAMVGDKDEVPGLPGIGPVGAKDILHAFTTLDRALDEAHAEGPARGANHPFFERRPKLWAKLVGSRKDAALAQKLARLRHDVPLGIASIDDLLLPVDA